MGHPGRAGSLDQLRNLSGAPIPAAALPSRDYMGEPRLFVLTVRTLLAQDEAALPIPIILLTNSSAAPKVSVHSRHLGAGSWSVMRVTRLAQGRGWYNGSIGNDGEDLEYFVVAELEGAASLRYPAAGTVSVTVMDNGSSSAFRLKSDETAAPCPANCSLAGDCGADGTCTCDAPWAGQACERLDQLPRDGTAKAFVAPRGSTTWGGTAMQSDDDRSEYYLFASLSRNTTIYGFSTSSVIVSAKSSSPTGPYAMLDPEAGPYTLGPREPSRWWDGVWVQNPVAARLHQSRGYLLFYAGGNDTDKHWSIGNASIGVAFATSLSGPWQRPDSPVIQPLPSPHWEAGGIANPAVVVDRHDDSILLAYRGTTDNGIAFLKADSWNGTYRRLFSGKRVFVDASMEDPYLIPGRLGLHMLMHDIKGDCNWAEGCHCTVDRPPASCAARPNVGAHAFAPVSAGGDAGWSLLELHLAAGPAQPQDGGYNLSAPVRGVPAQHFSHREEPKLLWSWSEHAQDWVPSHLFNVVMAGGPTATNWKSMDSWVHAQPLRQPPLKLDDARASPPQACPLFLARSEIAGGGTGVFAGKAFDGDELVEVALSVAIPKAAALSGSLKNYVYGHNESHDTVALGLAMMFNHHPVASVHNSWAQAEFPGENFLQHNAAELDEAALPDRVDCRAPGRWWQCDTAFVSTQPIRRGDEMYASYGDAEWFASRNISFSSAPDSAAQAPPDVIPGCGGSDVAVRRWGAYATRAYEAGEVVEVCAGIVLGSASFAGTALEPLVLPLFDRFGGGRHGLLLLGKGALYPLRASDGGWFSEHSGRWGGGANLAADWFGEPPQPLGFDADAPNSGLFVAFRAAVGIAAGERLVFDVVEWPPPYHIDYRPTAAEAQAAGAHHDGSNLRRRA